MKLSDWNKMVEDALQSHPEYERDILTYDRQVQKEWSQSVFLRSAQQSQPTNLFPPFDADKHIQNFLKDKPQGLNDILIQDDKQKLFQSQKDEVIQEPEDVKEQRLERERLANQTPQDKFKEQAVDTTGNEIETEEQRIERQYLENMKAIKDRQTSKDYEP